MERILYLHGFASSPDGRKATAVRTLLGKSGIEIVAPDLNLPSFLDLDFDAMADAAFAAAVDCSARAVVGSSLGALVALEVIRRGFSAPAILIAPALGVADAWLPRVPPGDPVTLFHYGENRELPIRRRFFERVAHVDVDATPPPAPVTVVMGRLDESVPFEAVRATWDRWLASGSLRAGSAFVELTDGDHGLTAHADRVAAEVVMAVRRGTA
jgi:hypothetical protein